MISTIWFYLHSLRTHLASCELISCTGKYLHKWTSAVLMIVNITISHSVAIITEPGLVNAIKHSNNKVKFELKIFVYLQRMSKLEDNIASGIAVKCEGDDDDFKIFSIGTNRRGWWTGFNAFFSLSCLFANAVVYFWISFPLLSNATHTHTHTANWQPWLTDWCGKDCVSDC